jgi:hypothetical protein
MQTQAQNLSQNLENYCQKLSNDFSKIDAERKVILEKISQFIQEKKDKKQTIQLNFICTHNSRRSQFGQVWAKIASIYYHITSIETFSGGTEATACNPRTIAALERAGIQIKKNNEISAPVTVANNPRYQFSWNDKWQENYLFSKKYNDFQNPDKNFCAILVCSSADEACPVVKGAEKRIYLPYEDPKKDDNTPQEESSYDQTCQLVALEMLYIFSKIK